MNSYLDAKKFAAALLDWYDHNARDLPWRKTKDPYAVWVSEIMLQQTRVETVIPNYERFLRTLPTVEALAKYPPDSLNKLWQGLGYYSRVRNMQKAAIAVMERYGGKLPSDAQDLRGLPGIGEYTAGSVASIAFEKRVPAVDGNVLRVFARILGIRESTQDKTVSASIRKEVEALLPDKRVGDFNQALMEVGATVCLPNSAPRCEVCPFRDVCVAFRDHLTEEIPLKTVAKKRPVQDWTVLLLRCGDKFALQKRGENELLASLWQFPMLRGALSFSECKTSLPEGFGALVLSASPVGPFRHIFTHLEWNMTGYFVTLASIPAELPAVWATKEEIDRLYSVPSAFRGFLGYL